MSSYQQLLLNKPTVVHHPKSDVILRLLGVTREEACTGELRILDEKDDLILVHYVEPVMAVRHIRGTIIDICTEKILVESFPFPEEFEIDKIKDLNTNVFDGHHHFSIGKEGTILRLFFYNGEWLLSTHRRIDGRRSRWAGPTFGKIFDELWDLRYTNYLNEKFTYILLLSHPENRIVCEIDRPTLMFLGVSTPIGGVQSFAEIETDILPRYFVNDIPNISFINRLNISSKQELEDIVETLDWRNTTGVIVHSRREDGRNISMKFNPKMYSALRDIRGNEPNLRLRYLQLQDDCREEELRNLFPEKKEYFDSIDNDLANNLPGYLEKLFLQRRQEFATHTNMTQFPKEVHYFLEGVRKNYDRNYTIRQNIVYRLLKTEGRYLNALLKYMKKSE